MNIPFERNNYFWGKLLSAEDFQAEQRYFNEKRQLLNRLVFGCGVLCGFEVLKLDEKKIVVQSGAALDHSGREVTLGRAVTKNLALIDGFSYENRLGFAYLCVSFEEKFHQEAVAIETGGEKQYNRISEEARLYLTQAEPEPQPEAGSLDEVLEAGGRIYLAKIFFVTGENTFVIERVEDIRRMIAHERRVPAPEQENSFSLGGLEAKLGRILREYARLTLMRPTVASGTETIDFGLGAKRGRVFYSPPVAHGLGAGPVSVTLGLVNETAEGSALSERSVFYGEAGIFDSEIALAAKINVSTGTFVIGARLLGDSPLTQARVFWTAVKNNAEALAGNTTYISISPYYASVRCRDSFQFTLDGIDKSSVVWSVAEPDGGSVDSNGLYRAPNKAGVFEVRAETEGQKTSAFVLVK